MVIHTNNMFTNVSALLFYRFMHKLKYLSFTCSCCASVRSGKDAEQIIVSRVLILAVSLFIVDVLTMES